ncbi:hypothetical protein IFY47_003299 [Salmonella enterica]|nr:hypothetical protein [Salmonella enterica]EJD1942365.1 hypothetical protein [Escherichia coli]
MSRTTKSSDAGIPFPSLFNDKKLISKVVPIFNHMHDTALTEKEALSLLDLVWRYANEQNAPEVPSQIKVIVADAENTVVQEIRNHYDKRPFILDFDGIEIEITAKMSITDALRAGMNATLKTVVVEKEEPEEIEEPEPVIAEPVVHRKKIIVRKSAVKAQPVPAPVPVPEPQPAPAPAPVIDEDEDEEDQSKYIGLQTYGVNPGEPLSRAVARVWPHRPALLVYEGKSIPITVEMSLIDAQIEAADVTGIDGNHIPESTSTISASGYVMPSETRPFDVAVFEHPIPVDDSKWDISLDRNSGADFIRTNRAVWLDDYPYRISCVPFEEHMNTQTMFYVHCREKPSQEMFDCYHALFRQHTHKVHIRKYDPATNNSRILTNEYCSWRPKEGVSNGCGAGMITTSVMEALGLNARWEAGARYRIRYWDTNVQGINHRYYASKPNDDALHVLRHPKLKPVIQTRPAGI